MVYRDLPAEKAQERFSELFKEPVEPVPVITTRPERPKTVVKGVRKIKVSETQEQAKPKPSRRGKTIKRTETPPVKE